MAVVSTRDRQAPAASALRPRPVLYLALECARPLEPSLVIPLDRPVTIGRGAAKASDVDGGRRVVQVPDECMSRRHAQLVPEAGGWTLEDLGSRNGTVLDGRPCTRATLRDGALLELGETLWLYREPPCDDDLEYLAGPAAAALPTLARPLQQAYADLARIAAAAVPVVIEGESGTGKEVVARAIHAMSRRRGPFVAVNCGAIPEHLVESELFGHRRGAFSGATEDRPGLIRAADGGTLFLDELADLPPTSQAALLRVLQDHEVVPVGGTRPTRLDLRVVAATNRDLAAAVRRGDFRADLLARLAGYQLALPPLRERREDLAALIAGVLARGTPLTLDLDAARALYRYPWPLNVRELEQALGAAVALARRGRIGLGNLPPALRSSPAAATLDDDEQALRDQLAALLRVHRGSVAEVARQLGKGRQQVHRWLKRVALDPAAFR